LIVIGWIYSTFCAVSNLVMEMGAARVTGAAHCPKHGAESDNIAYTDIWIGGHVGIEGKPSPALQRNEVAETTSAPAGKDHLRLAREG